MEIYQTHYLEDDSDLVILEYLILIDIVSHSFLVYIYIYVPPMVYLQYFTVRFGICRLRRASEGQQWPALRVLSPGWKIHHGTRLGSLGI